MCYSWLVFLISIFRCWEPFVTPQFKCLSQIHSEQRLLQTNVHIICPSQWDNLRSSINGHSYTVLNMILYIQAWHKKCRKRLISVNFLSPKTITLPNFITPDLNSNLNCHDKTIYQLSNQYLQDRQKKWAIPRS